MTGKIHKQPATKTECKGSLKIPSVRKKSINICTKSKITLKLFQVLTKVIKNFHMERSLEELNSYSYGNCFVQASSMKVSKTVL